MVAVAAAPFTKKHLVESLILALTSGKDGKPEWVTRREIRLRLSNAQIAVRDNMLRDWLMDLVEAGKVEQRERDGKEEYRLTSGSEATDTVTPGKNGKKRMETREIYERLSKLDPKTIKTKKVEWKDKNTGKTKSYSAKFISARTVMNILDTVVGPENWRAEFAPFMGTAVQCTLYLRADDGWIGKSDIGTPSDIEPAKGAVSDALKRAAVHWGIGRELYNEGTASFDDEDTPADPPAQPANGNGRRASKPRQPAPDFEGNARAKSEPPAAGESALHWSLAEAPRANFDRALIYNNISEDTAKANLGAEDPDVSIDDLLLQYDSVGDAIKAVLEPAKERAANS